MPADTPGRQLNVLTPGLRQLGMQCERLGGKLAAAAAPGEPGVSTWQSNAGTVNVAGYGTRKDLAALAVRMNASGAKYAAAATSYDVQEDDAANAFRGLVS